jgi:hypothetical protein
MIIAIVNLYSSYWIEERFRAKYSRVNMLVLMVAVVLLAVAAALLARTLPAQNIAFILVSLIACEMALEAFSADLALSWRGWIFWPAVVVLARVAFRWILRRWRQDWNYGAWLILLASAALALAQFALTLFDAGLSSALRGAALRFGSTALCLFVLTPWFISKLPQQPQERAQ